MPSFGSDFHSAIRFVWIKSDALTRYDSDGELKNAKICPTFYFQSILKRAVICLWPLGEPDD